MPGDGTDTGAQGTGEALQGSAEGQSNQTQIGESHEYSMDDALEDTLKDQTSQDKPPEKKPAQPPADTTPPAGETEQGAKAEDKPPEGKAEETQVEDKPPEIPKDYQEAKNFYDALKNPEYQKQLLQNLAQMHGMKLTSAEESGQKAPDLTPEQAQMKEVMDSLDPEVKAIFDHIQSSANDRISKLEAYIEKQEKAEQEARITKARDEFNEFVSANKEAMDKYKPQLDALARKIPGIFSGGKDGLKAALDLVSMEDRIKDAVAKAERDSVAKALGRSQGVAETVQHHAASTSQQRESHQSGGERVDNMEEAFNLTLKQLGGAV